MRNIHHHQKVGSRSHLGGASATVVEYWHQRFPAALFASGPVGGQGRGRCRGGCSSRGTGWRSGSSGRGGGSRRSGSSGRRGGSRRSCGGGGCSSSHGGTFSLLLFCIPVFRWRIRRPLGPTLQPPKFIASGMPVRRRTAVRMPLLCDRLCCLPRRRGSQLPILPRREKGGDRCSGHEPCLASTPPAAPAWLAAACIAAAGIASEAPPPPKAPAATAVVEAPSAPAPPAAIKSAAPATATTCVTMPCAHSAKHTTPKPNVQ